ncbi:unnamed protein product [Prorocentrum cordatum]|uniref:Uncharacterized protein n=1 Tax=Prorocentrum cordatum TaxID=2364126 RepID=A0ABN9U7L0_9DINO|nr:unnamed protein product [Polarella glacialis]
MRELAGLEQALATVADPRGAFCDSAGEGPLLSGGRAEELLQDVAPLQQREVEGGFELQLNLKKLQLKAKRLGEANVLLASQLSWTGLFLPTRPPPPAAFEVRFCCGFRHWVEGIASEAFLSLGRPLRLVELGVQAGELAEHLLSRYDWIHWTGVDLMIDADGNKYGFGQNRSLDLAGARVDLLVLDARFSPEGLAEDLRRASWGAHPSPRQPDGAGTGVDVLARKGSAFGSIVTSRFARSELGLISRSSGEAGARGYNRLVGRWGAAVVAELMGSERRLHRLRLGSQQDGAQWTVDVS